RGDDPGRSGGLRFGVLRSAGASIWRITRSHLRLRGSLGWAPVRSITGESLESPFTPRPRVGSAPGVVWLDVRTSRISRGSLDEQSVPVRLILPAAANAREGLSFDVLVTRTSKERRSDSRA